MKRLLESFLLLLFCNSCMIGEKKEVVEELLIFGYSEFCLVDSLNHVYPMDAWEHMDSVRLHYDSTRLDISQYFKFKKDSLIKLAIRKPYQETEYYSINPSNNMGLVNLINSAFKDKKHTDSYCFFDYHSGIYDGWYYTLYCKTSKGNTYHINYTPRCLPGELNALQEFVEDLFYKYNLPKANKFEYDSITTIEAKRIFKKYPPLPLPDKSIKFTPPVIIGQ